MLVTRRGLASAMRATSSESDESLSDDDDGVSSFFFTTRFCCCLGCFGDRGAIDGTGMGVAEVGSGIRMAAGSSALSSSLGDADRIDGAEMRILDNEGIEVLMAGAGALVATNGANFFVSGSSLSLSVSYEDSDSFPLSSSFSGGKISVVG